jgi:acetyl-CoA acyltransferase 1
MQRVQKLAAQLTAANESSGFTKDWDYRSVAQPGQTIGTLGVKSPDDVVVISAVRTAMGKGNKGSFKDTRPEDMLVPVLAAAIDRAGIKKSDVDDIVVGNCNPNGFAGPAAAKFMAGFPESVSWAATNRACSSGLSAIVNIAGEIRAGIIDVGIGAGVEKMTSAGGTTGRNLMKEAAKAGAKEAAKPAAKKKPTVNPKITAQPLARDTLIPMGITSENVAERYGITREEQDKLGFLSQDKASKAQKAGWFDSEIVPVTTTVEDKDGNETTVVVDKDEGIRATTPESLAKLPPAFKKGGTTTAGNSSQVTDGAAAVLLMRRATATKLGVTPLASLRSTALVGVPPDVMGIGPAYAIPEVLKKANLQVADIDVYEVNEAFASQAMFTAKKVGIPLEKLNPVGGAIALGHPLGCTGARQVATLLPQFKRQAGSKYGITSMCMGTGMGMAALWENEQ